MFKKIEIRGLGPHADTCLELDPSGVNHVHARSQSGKSTMVDGIAFALWGQNANGKPFDTGLARDGGDSIEVTLTTRSGNEITRTMEPGNRKTRRTLTKAGNDMNAGSEKDFAKFLGPLGARAEVARLVMSPMSWVALAEGPGGGRPLRDALSDLLPGGDLETLVASLMKERKQEFKKLDPITEKLAEKERREANRERDSKEGSLKSLRERLEATPPIEETEGPTPEDLEAANDVIRLHHEYEAYYKKHQEGIKEIPERQAKRARLDELKANEPPKVENVESHRIAVARLPKIEEELAEIEKRIKAIPETTPEIATAEAMALEYARKFHAMQKAGDKCPMCGKKGFKDAEKLLKEAEDALNKEQKKAAKLKAEHEEHRDSILEGLQDKKKALEAEAETLRGDVVEGIEEKIGDREAWEKEYNEIADFYRTIDLTTPEKPEGDRPTSEAVAAANETLQSSSVNRGAVEERNRARKELEEHVEATRKEYEEAVREAGRLDALVECCRKAPSIIAEKQAEALGDMGPVSLRFTDSGGVDVLIDGRPWYYASTGRKIYADARLRDALRRAAGMTYLPVFVDDSNLWSGEFDGIPGPVVYLHTSDVDGFEVEAG